MSLKKTVHVAAFAFPFGAHPTLLLHLVQRLAAAAPDFRFSYFNTAVANQKLLSSNAKLKSYDNIKVYDIEDGVPEGHVFSGNPLEPIDFFIEAAPGSFRRRLAEVAEEMGSRATCLLTDAFLWFSPEMAAGMGIPWMAFWTSAPASLSLHLYTDVIRSKLGQIGSTQDEDPKLDFLPGLSAIRASDLSPESWQDDLPFVRMLHDMSHALPRAAVVVLNAFDGFDPAVQKDLKSKLRKVVSIGPSPLPCQVPPSEDKYGCLSWLNEQGAASVVYIAFGTVVMPPPTELAALAEALEEKQIPYLWSFRDSSKRHLLQGFFERSSSIGKVVEWAPQLQVLTHSSVGAFVTHCGWNSTVESMLGGVPMICRPIFGDHFINRRCVEAWGAGVGIQGNAFTKSAAAAALDLVMLREGKKMRENIGRFRECAFRATAENGTSTQDFKSLVGIVTSIKTEH